MVALTEVNVHILELAVDAPSHELAWEFFCECGGRDCYEQVVLTIEEYTAVRRRGEAVLAAGHRLNPSARARRLREEALALRAQAEHQLTRARRAESLRHDAAVALLRAGARVWVNGRPATFRAHMPGGRAARVHFDGERGARVVALARLSTQPPPCEPHP